MSLHPTKEIRASYTPTTIRVYQAYRPEITDSALKRGTFQSPPFSLSRMTWIKPSFLWMMYRAGWGFKEVGQSRILAIDIARSGFEWALAHSCLSHPPRDIAKEEWTRMKAERPVRIQWDPERDFHGNPLPHRSIQIGLSGEAGRRYVSEWITNITEVTELAHRIHALVQEKNLTEAARLLPPEKPYVIESAELEKAIKGFSESS